MNHQMRHAIRNFAHASHKMNCQMEKCTLIQDIKSVASKIRSGKLKKFNSLLHDAIRVTCFRYINIPKQ